jgi:hypothetical protein
MEKGNNKNIMRTSFDVKKNLWRKFKSACVDNDLKIKDELEIMISKWLMKYENGGK